MIPFALLFVEADHIDAICKSPPRTPTTRRIPGSQASRADGTVWPPPGWQDQSGLPLARSIGCSPDAGAPECPLLDSHCSERRLATTRLLSSLDGAGHALDGASDARV